MPIFMNKTVIAAGIAVAAIAVSIAYGAQMNPSEDDENRTSSEIWNFRFSGQEFHDISSHGFDGISLETGATYQFKFVPMGDSPEQLRISLIGKSPSVKVFSESLYLKKTLMDTGISKYYTWDYVGENLFHISEEECYEKDPNSSTIFKKQSCIYELNVERVGNLMGSVTISIVKLDRSI